MEFNGINQVTNPLIIILPLIMMILSGYTIGRAISRIRRIENGFFMDLLHGNLMLSFLFISGFMIFGFLTPLVKNYFTVFTYALAILSILAVYLILKLVIVKKQRINLLALSPSDKKYFIFGICLFFSVIAYQAIVIYFHPIFSEYDSLYLFLPISKSILLGNGLNHDFYLGSDIAIKLPPFVQAMNAWLIHSFGYSSMRLFPVYFVIFSSFFVYVFTRNLTKDKFLSIIACTAFLITPALIITSSRFSLQQDIPLILFLSSTLYFFSEIARQQKPAKIHLIMLLISLSLMSLTREIGIVISVAVLFLVPALKFTDGNIKLRALLTFLSLLPLYLLTFYDIFNKGFTIDMTLRLVSLILVNCTLFYILYHVKNQRPFKLLVQTSAKYLIILVIPLIFFAFNMITISGPFATIIFSSQFRESGALYREVFDISTNQEIMELLPQNLPRADIFLVSVAMGSTFVFFRLRGFITLVEGIKTNNQYAMFGVLAIVLLVIWSFLLQSGFESAFVRHISYFLPFTSALLVLGLSSKRGTFHRLFSYGLIVFSTFYFLNYDLVVRNYNDHFAGFWLEPFKESTMRWNDFIFPGVLILVLLAYEFREQQILRRFRTYNFSRYVAPILGGLLGVQVYILLSSGLLLSPIEEIDTIPPNGWEENVFETVNYLNTADEGNVLSLRAPSISFFTNRTNYDIQDPHSFSSILPILQIKNNSALMKQKILDMDIKYIVMPNEKNSFYNAVRNVNESTSLVRTITSDEDFQKIRLRGYDLYKFRSNDSITDINVLEPNLVWKSVGSTKFSQINGTLRMDVYSGDQEKIFNRVYVQTQLNSTEENPPLLLSLDYATESRVGDALFYIQVTDKNNDPLWGTSLEKTNGMLTRESFVLPESIVNKPIQLKLYVITEEVGGHTLTISNALLSNR